MANRSTRLSIIVHKDFAYERGRALVSQNARTDSAADVRGGDPGGHRGQDRGPGDGAAIRKNVLAKCYGGDISRKRKLLEKQKEGKKRMKRIGKVDIPQEAFLAVLKIGEDSSR